MRSDMPYAKLGTLEMPSGVEARLTARLHHGQIRAHRMHKVRLGLYTATSLVVSIVSAISISSALSQSGAYDFLALVFKDTTALSYSKELFLSVIESLPLLGVATLLAGMLFVGITLPRLVRRQSSYMHA